MTQISSKELIAFYNVENLFLPDLPPVHILDPTESGLRNWNEKRYLNKIFKISHVFELIRESEGVLPMLIGFSEVQGKKPLQELVLSEPFNSRYGIVHYESMDERGVDVALIYDQNKIEILTSEPITYFFEIEDDDPSNYDTTRDVLHCKIKYKNKEINVFVLHLPSKREQDINKPKRDYILKDLRQRIVSLTKKKESVIVLGDFNENPDDQNITKLLDGDDAEILLHNPYQELFAQKNFSTFHYKDGLLFDQILISDDFYQPDNVLQFKKASVYNTEKLSSRDNRFSGRPFRTYAGTRYLGGYSDHYPVFATFDNLF